MISLYHLSKERSTTKAKLLGTINAKHLFVLRLCRFNAIHKKHSKCFCAL